MSIVRDLSIGTAALAALAALALRLPPAAPPSGPAPETLAPASAGRPAAVAPRAAAPIVPAGPAVAATPAVRDRNGRAIDLQGQDVAGYIAARAAAARVGDARAAYQVYQATSLCAAAETPLPDFDMPAERAEADAERTRLGALCARVSAAQVRERLDFLAQAAAAGKREARIDFFMEGPPGADLDADDPLVRAWKAQALGFLQAAGAQCDPFALALLANAYDLGQLVPRDWRMAMVYAVAEHAARHTALSEQDLRDRFGALPAPGDLAAALQAGVALAQGACPANR